MTKFIDANIFVKAFTNSEEKEECRDILSTQFITNTLCLVEAIKMISTIKKDKIYAAKSIRSLYAYNCTIIDLDKNLLFEAIKRMDKYDLKMFDLINYVTALLNGCTEFVSYDRDFNGLEIKRIEP
ncbi:PIN domain-containing protein [Candidatus Woesearchaeota archaeon]|nr:PIN domain-containing protein [Candidatus Woesearchaeota archaeon]